MFGPRALTKRQSEVLDMWVQGLSIGQMAEKLGLARATVHQHKKYALKKVGYVTRHQGRGGDR